MGVGVQGILTGITARTAEIERQNEIIENSIKDIENQLDILKQKYDAATASAKAQASAANSAANAYRNAASAAREYTEAQKAALNNVAENIWNYRAEAMNMPTTRQASGMELFLPKFHSGTNYVKKANSWLDDMLGLGPNETASILKVGEAVIPDYANPNANSFGTQSFSIDKPASVGAPISNQDNSVTIKIGDIIIQGDADENTVAKLNKTKESIIQEMFKRINKHSMMNGYKNVRYSN